MPRAIPTSDFGGGSRGGAMSGARGGRFVLASILVDFSFDKYIQYIEVLVEELLAQTERSLIRIRLLSPQFHNGME